ncbi:MAG: TIGR03790 family protein, partial [Candidatus Omnitrophica bacterium]|nr:TIGR03790 family protein [Candidatus Omnitrophota bacterium]
MMKRWLIAWGCLGVVSLPFHSTAAESGAEVAVVYNQRMSESKEVAKYYASRRKVPATQVFGFDLPETEAITRSEFGELLQRPLLHDLEKEKLLTFEASIQPATETEPGQVYYRVKDATIRYLVLCYGVPLKILTDTNLIENGESGIRIELRRNDAAVDSELAMLPLSKSGYRLFGPLMNPLFGTTNSFSLRPANGLLMVSRLDGPSSAIARGLVDKAIQAETDGLWGRAYFDARGLSNGNYKMGDDWIRNAAEICRRLGFSTVLDNQPATFSTAFPMSQIAFYAGWYDANVSGPFTLPH